MEMNRRQFVAGAAAATAAMGASVAMADPSPVTSEPNAIDYTVLVEEVGEPTQFEDVDILVIGAGGCGMAAGISATEAGLKTVVLEKKAFAGGTFFGSEGLFAVNSHWQKEAGIDIDIEEIIGRLMTYHHYVPDPELYRTFFQKTAETVDWLEAHNVAFSECVALGDSDPTWHLYAGEREKGLGAQFMASFIEYAEGIDVDIRFETIAKQLIMADGKVCGALATDKEGNVWQFNAKAVIIGTGGYANNDEMMRQLCEVDPAKICAAGMNGRDGSGIRMARNIGAVMAPAPGTAAWYGPILYGTVYGTPVQAATSLQPCVWINEHCKRFVREDMFHRNFPYAGMAHKSQETVYTLFNQALLEHYATDGVDLQVGVYCETGHSLPTLLDDVEELFAEGNEHIWRADTLAEVAEAAGLDAAALEATMAEYNENCAAGVDPKFGKPAEFMNAMEEGPFYICEVQNGYFCTVGGIKITTKLEACDEKYNPIPGIYMGGMDAAGFYGDAYDAGIAAGSCASWAINSGRLAVENAIEYISTL